MTRYKNGAAPLADLVNLGPQFYLPHGTAARWRELQRLAWEKYGVWLVPSAGWNGYRPLDIQYEYRKELGIWAAVPGYSSHGLTFNGRDCAAIDVNNWRSLASSESLAWSRFVALCRIVGFTVDFVSPQELWHIGDFDPFNIPSFAVVVINPETTAKPSPSEEEDMPFNVKSNLGETLVLGDMTVRFPSPDDVAATKINGQPVTIMETSPVMHAAILAEAALRRTGLPLIVYAEGGDGTVYIFQNGEISYLSDPATLHDLLARGAAQVRWSQAEIDGLRKQQG